MKPFQTSAVYYEGDGKQNFRFLAQRERMRWEKFAAKQQDKIKPSRLPANLASHWFLSGADPEQTGDARSSVAPRPVPSTARSRFAPFRAGKTKPSFFFSFAESSSGFRIVLFYFEFFTCSGVRSISRGPRGTQCLGRRKVSTVPQVLSSVR